MESNENNNANNTIVALAEEAPLQQQLEEDGEREPSTLTVGSLVMDDANTAAAPHEAEEERLPVAETLPEIVEENNNNSVVVEPIHLFVLDVQVCENLSFNLSINQSLYLSIDYPISTLFLFGHISVSFETTTTP